jgi:predicted nucleic acid-binding protein
LTIYADTSFIVSLYSLDINSEAAIATIDASNAACLLTTFGELEVVNALMLREFRKEISSAEARSAVAAFDRDLQSGAFHLSPLPEQAFVRARQLAQQTTVRLGTRTGFLLHVAAALELRVDYFFSFDKRQRALAQAVRLKLN